MPYTAICYDRPGDTTGPRADKLQKHLDYIAGIAGQVLVAGPMSIEGSTNFNASLFVYAVDTEDEARRLLENDPYFQAGIYGDIRYAAFTPARGTWLRESL